MAVLSLFLSHFIVLILLLFVPFFLFSAKVYIPQTRLLLNTRAPVSDTPRTQSQALTHTRFTHLPLAHSISAFSCLPHFSLSLIPVHTLFLIAIYSHFQHQLLGSII